MGWTRMIQGVATGLVFCMGSMGVEAALGGMAGPRAGAALTVPPSAGPDEAGRQRILDRIYELEASIAQWKIEIPEYQRLAREADSIADKAYYGGLATGLAYNVAEANRELIQLKRRLGL